MEHSVDFLLGSVKPTDKTTSHIHRLSDEIALDVLIKMEHILEIVTKC
jgi:hypothetical protein